jgi:hypothetical protein
MTTTSKEINLKQLDEELGGKGLIADFTDSNNKLIKTADGSDITEEQLEAAIVAHIALPSAGPTITEKLASVGLSIEELRTALGSN